MGLLGVRWRSPWVLSQRRGGWLFQGQWAVRSPTQGPSSHFQLITGCGRVVTFPISWGPGPRPL